MLTILILLYLNKHYSIAGGVCENKPEETTVECNRSIVIMSLNYPK